MREWNRQPGRAPRDRNGDNKMGLRTRQDVFLDQASAHSPTVPPISPGEAARSQCAHGTDESQPPLPPEESLILDGDAAHLTRGPARPRYGSGNAGFGSLICDHFLSPGRNMTVTTIDIADLQELIAGGAQVVEVLPGEDYEKLHLPGAISLPLAELNADTAERLDRGRDVVVYCWDGL